jgi:transglutaminase-like putative cysteine protease
VKRSGHVQLAAATASALTGLTLGTLVQGMWWFVEVVLVVVAVSGAGAGARRLSRQPLVAVAAQLAALLVVLTWLYARPEALVGLLPGLDSTSTLLRLGAEGVETSRTVAPPAPAEPGIRLLVSAGVGAVAVAVDLLAVGLRQPAVAGLPLLAVYCVPAALARGGLGWYWFVLPAAGYLQLVASDAGDRVARWGRVLHGRGGEAAPMAATGRRVGALALVSAVVVPTLVPGLGEGLLFGTGLGSGPGSGGRVQVVNPIFSLRDNLAATQDTPVLSYQTTGAPQPLRIVTVDTFDGTSWQPTLGTVPRSNSAAGGLPAAPGLGAEVASREQRYRITIDSLRQAWLPVPYPPTRVDILGPWLYDDALNVLGDGVTTEPGMTYDVRYLDVAPTPEQLLAAPPPAAGIANSWAALPEGVPPVVRDTARQVAGTGSAYEQAVRLQGWLRSDGGFQYSPQAPDANTSSALADFLDRRSGYCVHFASAMAVMARSLGIPARVAVGFLPGSREADGTYTVTLRDAHAWPELYFGGVGWVRFEPTPATRSGGLPSWAAPSPNLTGRTPSDTPEAAPPAADGAGESSTSDPSAGAYGFDLGAALAAVPWRLVALAAVVLAVLGAPAGTSVLLRRRRWRQAAAAADPAEVAETAWTTLVERVRDLGVPVSVAATPRQAELQLAPGLAPRARDALHHVARAVERARYAPRPAEATRLRPDVGTVVGAVAHRVGRRARLRARLLPPSGVEHLRSSLVDAGLALDRAERSAAARLRSAARSGLRSGVRRVSASGRRGGGPSGARGAA